MKKAIDIPKGYKQSPVGVIPKDWEVKKLKDLGEISSGTTPSRKNEEYYINGNIPWVKTTDLNNGAIFSTEEYVTEAAIKECSLKILPKGTILIAMYGGFNQIGRTGLLAIDATVNQAISGIVLYENEFNGYYILQYLNANVYRWKKYAASSRKDPNITGQDVANFNIAIPPTLEQRKIAELLSTWDKAIELQTSIINKLTLRKKGLMQQLLTGKKRLKGFTEPWNKIRLGAIGKTYNGLAGITKDDFDEGSDKYIPYINIYMNGVVNTSELGSVRINSRQNTVAYGDILFTTSSETPNEVGFSSVLLNEVDNLYLNSFCFGYRLINFNSLIPQYAAYYFRSNIFRKKMYKLAQGSI